MIDFFECFKECHNINNAVLINLSTHFDAITASGFNKMLISEEALYSESDTFDMVFGVFDVGGKPIENRFLPVKINTNWNYIFESLKCISETGCGFFIVLPSFFYSNTGMRLTEALASKGFYINAAYKMPIKIYKKVTPAKLVVIQISKKKKQNLFIADLDGNVANIVKNYKEEQCVDVSNGTWVEQKTFKGFHSYETALKINNFQSQYKDYQSYRMDAVIKEINCTNTVFEDKPNALYISQMLINKKVYSSLKNIKKHKYFFQIVLNDNIVISDYLALFYNSELGSLILDSLLEGVIMPHITRKNLKNSIALIPSLQEQQSIAATHNRIIELQTYIDSLKVELALKPKKACTILDKFSDIQDSFQKLSEEEKILKLVGLGECKTTEFKQTFQTDIHTNKINRDLKAVVVKTITAFLNTDGGTLLVGVADNGDIIGIEEDSYKTNDDYISKVKDFIASKVDKIVFFYIEYGIFNVLDKKILKIECKPSQQPIYYDKTELYYRVNPATHKLTGSDLDEYLEVKFNS